MAAVEKVPLFNRPAEWLHFSLLLLIVFSVNLFQYYRDYRDFSHTPFLHLEAMVLNQYQKQKPGRPPYTVLKLQSGDLTFYTTTREDLKPLKERVISLTVITKGVSFYRYLGTFYAPSFGIGMLPRRESTKAAALSAVARQHDDPHLANLFGALFFAEPVGKALRDAVSDFGVSHLIALSGYHLGFLGAIIWLLLKYPYTRLQQNLFPWRNRHIDLGFASALILLGYMLFTGSPPSLLRAYGMLLIGLFLLSRWIDLLSFATLGVSVGLLVALMPKLLFSLGFWFSVAGVFYIYLFLHHTSRLRPLYTLVGLNLFIFAAMLPVVHALFEKFTLYQFLSPLITLAFALFYPLAIILHLIGLGAMIDPWLQWLFETEMTRYTVSVSPAFLLFYLVLSLLAAVNRRYFYLYLTALGGFVLTVFFGMKEMF